MMLLYRLTFLELGLFSLQLAALSCSDMEHAHRAERTWVLSDVTNKTKYDLSLKVKSEKKNIAQSHLSGVWIIMDYAVLKKITYLLFLSFKIRLFFRMIYIHTYPWFSIFYLFSCYVYLEFQHGLYVSLVCCGPWCHGAYGIQQIMSLAHDLYSCKRTDGCLVTKSDSGPWH